MVMVEEVCTFSENAKYNDIWCVIGSRRSWNEDVETIALFSLLNKTKTNRICVMIDFYDCLNKIAHNAEVVPSGDQKKQIEIYKNWKSYKIEEKPGK